MSSFGKELYIGKVIKINPYMPDGEGITIDYLVFRKSKDKNTGASIFTPLKEKVGYYSIVEMNPLSSYLEGKDKFITKDKAEKIIQKIKQEESHNKVLKLNDPRKAA